MSYVSPFNNIPDNQDDEMFSSITGEPDPYAGLNPRPRFSEGASVLYQTGVKDGESERYHKATIVSFRRSYGYDSVTGYAYTIRYNVDGEVRQDVAREVELTKEDSHDDPFDNNIEQNYEVVDNSFDDIIMEGIEMQQNELDELHTTHRLHQEPNQSFSYLQSANFDHILKIVSNTSDQGVSKFQDLVRLAGGGSSNVVIDESLRSDEDELMIGLMKFIKHVLLSNNVLASLALHDKEKYSLTNLGEKSNIESQRAVVNNFYELAKVSGNSLKKMNFSEPDRMSVLSTVRKRYCLLSICSEILSRRELKLSRYDGELLTLLPSDIVMREGSFVRVDEDKIELDFSELERALIFCAGSNVRESRTNCTVILGVSNSKFPFNIGSEINGRLILKGITTHVQENKTAFNDRTYVTEVVSVSVPVIDSEFESKLISHLINSNVIEISGVSASRGIGLSNRGYYSIHNGSLKRKYSKRSIAYINVVVTIYPNLIALLSAMSSNVMRMTYALTERMLHDYNANKMHEVLPFYINGPERELLPSNVFHSSEFVREVTSGIKREIDRVRDISDASDVPNVMIFISAVFEYMSSTKLINTMYGSIADTEHALFSFGRAANSLVSSISNTILTISDMQNDLLNQDYEMLANIGSMINDGDKLGEVLDPHLFNGSVLTFIERVKSIYSYKGGINEIDKLVRQYVRIFVADLFAFHFTFDKLYDINEGYAFNESDELKKFMISNVLTKQSTNEVAHGAIFSAGSSILKMYGVRTDEELLGKLKSTGSNTDISELLTMSYLNNNKFNDLINKSDDAIVTNLIPRTQYVVDSNAALSSDTIKIFTNATNDNVFMVVRGTDPTDPHDVALDARIYRSFTQMYAKPTDDKRIIEAQRVYDILKKGKAKVFILGHSLGGYIASNIKGVRKTDLIITYNKLSNIHDVKDNEISIRIKGDVPSFLAKDQSITKSRKGRKPKKKLTGFPLVSNLVTEAIKSHEISQIKSEYFI